MARGKSNLITPSGNIIGDTARERLRRRMEENVKASKTDKLQLTGIDTTLKTKDYSSAIKYNKEINQHPEAFDKLILRDNFIMIKLFKYDKESKSSGGIIVDEMEVYETGGGQLRGRSKSIPYQKRGVVVKTALNIGGTEFFDMLKPGVIIHTATNELKEFHLDKSVSVAEKLGYFMIHSSAVECIENE